MKEIPVLVLRVFWFIDVGQRSRSQRAVTQKRGEYNVFVTIRANFTKIRSCAPEPGEKLVAFLGQNVQGLSTGTDITVPSSSI